MKLYEMLNLNLEESQAISFVGAGGKSTSMDALAKELREIGKKVLVTTTTVIFEPQHRDHDHFILGNLPQDYLPLDGSITLFGKSMDDSKIRGIAEKDLEEIYKRNIFDVILIEADGARMKPLKAPANHEPAVPSFSTMTIGLIGLDSIGMPLDKDHVHRPEILSCILDVDLPHRIDKNDIVNLIEHKDGILKGSYGEKTIFLNKACNNERILLGREIRRLLYDKGYRNIYVTDIISGKYEEAEIKKDCNGVSFLKDCFH